MRKKRKVYKKKHTSTGTSLFDQVKDRALDDYKDRDVEDLRTLYRQAKGEVLRYPSLEAQGRLSALTSLGKAATCHQTKEEEK